MIEKAAHQLSTATWKVIYCHLLSLQVSSLDIDMSVNEAAFHVFEHEGSFLSKMLQFIHVLTFFFADTVQLFAVVLSSDPCINVHIFLLVYWWHQFLILTPFTCTVIQALNNLRWKRNCQAISYLTKVKESQRSLHVLGIKSRFPYQHFILCGSLKGMKG